MRVQVINLEIILRQLFTSVGLTCSMMNEQILLLCYFRRKVSYLMFLHLFKMYQIFFNSPCTCFFIAVKTSSLVIYNYGCSLLLILCQEHLRYDKDLLLVVACSITVTTRVLQVLICVTVINVTLCIGRFVIHMVFHSEVPLDIDNQLK